MANVARLQYLDGSPTIEYTPPTRVATATWTLHDLRYPAGTSDYTVASGSGTLDAASVALGADSGPGEADPHLITVADTSDLAIEGIYQISDDHGSELVVLDGLTTNTNARTAAPILGSYDSTLNGVLEGVTFTATLAASVASDASRMENDDPLRIVWVHPDGSRHQQQVRLLRDNGSDLDLAAIYTDLCDNFPDIGTRAEHNGKGVLRRLIASQARQLEAMERARGEEPTTRLGGDERHYALMWKVLMHLASMGNRPGQDDVTLWANHCESQFNMFWHGATSGPGGRETARMVQNTGEATGSTDVKHTATIRGL